MHTTERIDPMARRRPKNRTTLTTVIIALVLLALYQLMDTNGFLSDQEAMSADTQSGFVEVHFIDVGQGDSIYIKTPTQDILIDGGERGDTVVEYLKEQNVEDLELVIGTHPHADHIGGLINVFEQIPVTEVMDPGVVHTSKTFEDYLTLIDQNNMIFTVVRAGTKRTYDDGTILEILSPTNPGEENLNDASIVAKLTFGDISFLFTGDAETPSENEMLSSGYQLKSTILKAGHHGSSTSTSDDFLKAVSPEAVVIMCGTDNSYGHPMKKHWINWRVQKLKSIVPICWEPLWWRQTETILISDMRIENESSQEELSLKGAIQMKAVVDRIEEQIAVVLFGDEEIKVNIPLELLPEGTREGSHLSITFELDAAGEASKREKISNLLNKLSNKTKE